MKKVTALFLVAILLISIAVTALAACNHSWYDVSTTSKCISKTTIRYNKGCIYHLNIPHTHARCRYEVTQRYVCKNGCGETKTVTSYKTTEKCPIK